MKRILWLILAMTLIFVFTADAFAASKPKITKQPVDGTVKKGKVTFTCEITGEIDALSWYFVNPETQEKIASKNIGTKFKKLKVTKPNKGKVKKLALSNVPEELHGWQVYCHVTGNGYRLDSDPAYILFEGKEAPVSEAEPKEGGEEATAPPAEAEKEPAETEKEPTETEKEPAEAEQKAPAAEVSAFTAQPEDGVVKNGQVTFSAATDLSADSVLWYFVDPETQEKIAQNKIKEKFAKVSVSKSDDSSVKTLTIKNVPEEMNGWQVCCLIKVKKQKYTSDTARIIVEAEAEAPADEQADETAADETATEAAPEETSEPAAAEESAEAAPADGEENVGDVPVSTVIKVTAAGQILYKVDALGAIVDEEPVSELEFSNIGSFAFRVEEPITNWTINGVRFESDQPVSELKVLNVTSDITVIPGSASAAEPVEHQIDQSRTCKVTCRGCTFTCFENNLFSVTEGEVFAGCEISVRADSSAMADRGYVINGGAPDKAGQATFRIVVEEDLTIVLE